MSFGNFLGFFFFAREMLCEHVIQDIITIVFEFLIFCLLTVARCIYLWHCCDAYVVFTIRNAEKQFVAEADEVEPGTEWERIAKLCEFNPKSSRTSKDVSRMRSIILQLKQSPPIPINAWLNWTTYFPAIRHTEDMSYRK